MVQVALAGPTGAQLNVLAQGALNRKPELNPEPQTLN